MNLLTFGGYTRLIKGAIDKMDLKEGTELLILDVILKF